MMDVALGFFLGSLFGLGLGLQLCRWKFGEEAWRGEWDQ